MMRVALIHSLIRLEERLLVEAFGSRSGVSMELVHESELSQARLDRVEAVLIRSMSQYHASTIARMVESMGVVAVNRPQVIDTCGDKIRTALALRDAGIPQPTFRVAFSPDEALLRMEEVGYPCVLKPPIGSWGRLLAKLNDRDAAEAVLDHKARLGGPHHHIYFIQEYIEHGNCDLRVFMAGEEPIAAIERRADHWITNTARGARVTGRALDSELVVLSRETSNAVGGGLLAIDLLETSDGYLVNEVNDRMEFKNSIEPTGVDIAEAICDYVLTESQRAVEAVLVP